jgi:hypothetical protein
MRQLFLVIIFCCSFLESKGQFAMPFEDNRRYFYLFINGAPQQLETQPVLQYKVAGDELIYINTANELRTYYNGQKTKAGEGLNAELGATQGMAWYSRDNSVIL